MQQLDLLTAPPIATQRRGLMQTADAADARPQIACGKRTEAAPDVAATSRDAFRQQVEPTLTERQRRVLKALRELGGRATLDEVCAHLGRWPNQESGRFTELNAAGLIRRTDERRPTRSGGEAFVWEVVE